MAKQKKQVFIVTRQFKENQAEIDRAFQHINDAQQYVELTAKSFTDASEIYTYQWNNLYRITIYENGKEYQVYSIIRKELK